MFLSSGSLSFCLPVALMCSGICDSTWISVHSTNVESEITSCGSSLDVAAVVLV